MCPRKTAARCIRLQYIYSFKTKKWLTETLRDAVTSFINNIVPFNDILHNQHVQSAKTSYCINRHSEMKIRLSFRASVVSLQHKEIITLFIYLSSSDKKKQNINKQPGVKHQWLTNRLHASTPVDVSIYHWDK